MLPRERLGSRSIFVFAICLGHLGIVALLDRAPATRSMDDDEPIMRLTFFDAPRQSTAPKAQPQASHGARRTGRRNSKLQFPINAPPIGPDVPAEVSPATPQVLAPGVDWMAEGQRIAQDYISRTSRRDSLRSLDGTGTGPRLLRSLALSTGSASRNTLTAAKSSIGSTIVAITAIETRTAISHLCTA